MKENAGQYLVRQITCKKITLTLSPKNSLRKPKKNRFPDRIVLVRATDSLMKSRNSPNWVSKRKSNRI
ncbi:hypothetical protein DLM77_05935 [Leptospira yasudae]|uniref:Uncharacterized protein n=1 Tax=Leptospira yasudae TaxID=2202201 RepID=A0ABX9M6S0_9LEPT|nr:hypothetical protein DLM77_05935 [Leptospira yasudae]